MLKKLFRACSLTLLLIPYIALAEPTSIAPDTSIEEILTRKKLRVGVCKSWEAPFYYKNKNGDLTGIDIDIARKIAKELGVEVEFIFTDDWNQLIDLITQNKIDMSLSYISITPKRSIRVAYSREYCSVKQTFLVNRVHLARAKGKGLNTLSEIFDNPNSEFTVLVDPGSSYFQFAQDLFPNAKLVPVPGGVTEAVPLLLADKNSAYFSDEVEINDVFNNNMEYKLNLTSFKIKNKTDVIAIPINEKSTKLLRMVDAILQADNFHFTIDELVEKYKE